MDSSLLNEIIIGRVEPHIYAFSTNSIPNYLKVGDTYRSVEVRLKEWQIRYPLLKKEFDSIAKINDVYFRDFSIHKYLEVEKQKVRLSRDELSDNNLYYSKEFFKDVSIKDLNDAIKDIKDDYFAHTQKYSFFNAETLKPEETVFQRTEDYPLRPNQKDTVEAFKKAVVNGHHNLLMYAVMRFGKSFTSMCCAVANNAKLVLVVSAKADVLLEWKKTVESHISFEDYDFISARNLSKDNHLIKKKLSSGRKVVVFLTLQDLQGKTIKDKHQEVFGQEIDLLLVDETHFGARAENYGEVLKGASNYVADAKNKKDVDDFVESTDADKVIKTLKAKNTIHLSGTPYRILMGSEFSKGDIIAFYQFTDIANDQKKWDEEHILDDNCKEWDNPYYGFPQMVRFAFAPNESTRRKLESLKKGGTTYAFSALFRPKSIVKVTDGSHRQFQNEKEILDLFSVIDGSKEDDCLLGFLDYDKIKEGNMCRHIVVVLPYCASCDALENLIKSNKDKFKNLGKYEIINISGVDDENKYKTANDVKRAITKYELEGKKTITLTVNRMLTGSTVPEWDTMLFFKDTASPQEYDQAVFRLQNQYIKTYKDSDGNTIKYNMKPQTLLVDFDPNRMFVMQEKKSKIYNANVDTGGNKKLEKRIQQELEISPIITINKDKIVKVVATDILDAVSNYRKDKGIKDEALDTPVDLSVLGNSLIRSVIEKENEIGSKQGLSTTAHEQENGEDKGNLDVPDSSENKDKPSDPAKIEPVSIDDQKKLEQSLSKKIQSYYTRILLFAFITNDTVISLSDIIEKSTTENNARVIKNLGLNIDVLMALNENINKFVLSDLDYKIQNLNKLSNDKTLRPEEKASVAINKFGKFGDAIVVTPSNICDDMVRLIPEETFKTLSQTNKKILDIAGTAGEYAVALYKKMISLGIELKVIKNSIYTIPKSSICYELTRKLYEMLGLNVANISKEFIATNLLEVKKGNDIDYDKIRTLLTQDKPFESIKLTDLPKEGEKNMIKFEAVVGNPPYQIQGGSGGSNDAPIYQMFAKIAEKSSVKYVSLIIPARWFAAGRENLLGEFRTSMINNKSLKKMIVFANGAEIFSNVEIKSGICYYLIDKNYYGCCDYVYNSNGKTNESQRDLSTFDVIIREPKLAEIVKKVKEKSAKFVDSIISNDTPFGISSNPKSSKKNPIYVSAIKDKDNNIKLYHIENLNRKIEYINRNLISKNKEFIDKDKVFIPGAGGSGNDSYVLGKPIVAPKGSVCSQSFLFAAFGDEMQSYNFKSYLLTKFFRVLVSAVKISQSAPNRVYRFVPLQDFTNTSDIDWSKSVEEIDKQLYAKYNLDDSEIAFIESMIKPMK